MFFFFLLFLSFLLSSARILLCLTTQNNKQFLFSFLKFQTEFDGIFLEFPQKKHIHINNNGAYLAFTKIG